MSSRRLLLLPLFAFLFIAAASAQKKQPPPPPAHAKSPSPAVTDEYIHKQFGDNCSLLAGPPQFVADLDGDGVDDLVVAAKCKNPMADKDEYSFVVTDPYDTALGYSDVKVTSTFASDAPDRRGVCLLIVHGAEKDAWRAETPKAKFLLINLPFKTLTVKKLARKKETILGIYMEESGEGENTSSVLFWDGKKYRYQMLGATLDD
ncbi:MAG TPA: hypothetical protein VHW45_17950 [Candidatus Sulfotelmatobacter sp.]|jgi:hypothetical protein|nr:hypothetical protein [Candidatus Sulfotelmatobacter sp.]